MPRNNANDDLPHYNLWDIAMEPDDPEYRWVRIGGGNLPCPDVTVRVGKPTAGRIVCTGIRIGAPTGPDEYEVTSRMLRDVRLGNILRAIREGMGGVGDDLMSLVVDTTPAGEPVTLGQALGARAATLGDLSVRRGRKGLDPETLQRTAEVYRQAVAEGATQPLAVTAQRLDVHPSTVWRRLQTAWERFPELRPEGGKS